MRVYLTFDIEVWCNGWTDLDSRFPGCFDRYVFGHSRWGNYALPKTLEVLARHGLSGVFFVEPLFAGRFGIEYLAAIVGMIRAADHDIQLHLHPEWADEIRPLVFPGACRKRQHLSFYNLEEQCSLIALGCNFLAPAGGGEVTAFRAGSFAANADTYRALTLNGIHIDSSLNACHVDSGVDLRDRLDFLRPQEFERVCILPMTVFRDGTGRLRPAQVGACSFGELRGALESARERGVQHFVLLSHNFEMLKQGSSEPDRIVVRRFERLCEYLAANPEHYEVTTFAQPPEIASVADAMAMPNVPLLATMVRHGEQALRRVFG